MALNAYMKVVGETQGEFWGSVTTAGRENKIMVIAYCHEVLAASEGENGHRKHGELKITKEIDRATPLLQNALVNGEKLSTVELQFWQPSKTGKEVQYYTVELLNASIAGIQQKMLNNKYPENMPHEVYEDVSFSYQKITWTIVDGGITAEDDWEPHTPQPYTPAPIPQARVQVRRTKSRKK